MSCIKKIIRGIDVSCKPLQGGVNDKLILVNYEDIIAYTYSTLMPVGDIASQKYITAISRTTGTQGYLFEGLAGSSIIVRKNMERGTYFPNYTTEIEFVAFRDSGTTENTLEHLNKSKLVAFYESNGEYHAIGVFGGMFVVSNNGDTSDGDTKGGHRIILRANNEGEYGKRLGIFTPDLPNPPLYDSVATKALFDSLLTPAP